MNRLIKTVVIAVLCIVAMQVAVADNKDIIIMETGTGFGEQTWFYSGYGKELQDNYIKEYWDKGFRITSTSYGASGWFVTMATHSGFTMQTYNYCSNWPSEWITERIEKGYKITSACYGNGKWFIVLSQNTPYTDQMWSSCSTAELSSTIQKYWDRDLYISTACCYDKDKWFIVASQDAPYSDQTWSLIDSEDEAYAKIKEIRDSEYFIQIVQYGDGQYLVVGSKYQDGHLPIQTFQTGNAIPGNFIKEKWDKNFRIAYAGGGVDYSSGTSNSYASSQGQSFLPDLGNTIYMARTDGIPGYASLTACCSCSDNGKTIYTYGYNGIPVGQAGAEGFGYIKEEERDGYEVLQEYYYSLLNFSDQTAYIKFKGSNQILISKQNGTIINSHGVKFNQAISKEQTSELAKKAENFAHSIDAMSRGGYTVPSGNGNSSGSESNKSSTRKSHCPSCNGTGICTSCKGAGGYWDYYGYSADKIWRKCTSCNGTGRCFNCYGSGHL